MRKTWEFMKLEFVILILLKVKLLNLSLTSSGLNSTTRPLIVELVIVKFYMSTVSAEPLKQNRPVSLVSSLMYDLEINSP